MPNQINSNNTLRAYDASEVLDVIFEMQERTDSIHYMIDTLRSEISVLPEITGIEKAYLNSITQ